MHKNTAEAEGMRMYTIMVVGAGYVGTSIGEYFVSKKQRVYGIVKSKASSVRLKEKGIEPLCFDLLASAGNVKIPPAHFIVISLAPDERSDRAYELTYIEAVNNFLQAIQDNPRPYLVVYISSTRVWEQPSLEWVDEGTAAQPVSNQAKTLLMAERQVLTSGYPSLVLRLSGIYGPGRNRIERFKSCEFRKAAPDKFLNFIHLEDAVGSVASLFKSGEVGEIYTGVDDEPILESVLYRWLAEALEVSYPASLFEKGDLKGKRLLNNKLKSIGYKFKYPTFRQGYRDLLKKSL